MRLADKLRARMVVEMKSRSEYADLNNAVVNADMPNRIPYESIEHQVTQMANRTEFVGDLEIDAVSKMLNRRIDVHSAEGLVRTYGEKFVQNPPYSLMFTVLGANVGHYDCLLIPLPKPLITPEIISHLTNLKSRAKRSCATASTVLTSTPYKENLRKKQ